MALESVAEIDGASRGAEAASPASRPEHQGRLELLLMEEPGAAGDRRDRIAQGAQGAQGSQGAWSARSAWGAWGERDECIARLFDEHYKGLCRLAGLLLNDSAAAEEVVQEAFLRTFSSWWRVRHPERAQWYLRTSVVNLSRSKLRRRGSEDRGNRVSWVDEDRRSGPDATDLSDDTAMLAGLVRGLPPRQREAVVLRYYEDLPESEIARLLGCAVGTIKSQLSKARATLAEAMDAMAETERLGGDSHA